MYQIIQNKLNQLVKRQEANFFKSSLLDQKIGYIKGVLDTCDGFNTKKPPFSAYKLIITF